MSMSIRNLTDEDRGGYKNILLYGDSGTGKTHTSATAVQVEEMRPVLFISVEDKVESIMNVEGYEDIEVLTFDQWRDLNDIYEYIEENDFNTIVIDSATRLQQMANDFITGREGDEFTFDGDISSPSRNSWGKILLLFNKVVDEFNKLDCNVIYTALQDREKDDYTGKVKQVPSFSGSKTSNTISAKMDIVGKVTTYTKDGETKRAIKFSGDDSDLVNDTTNRLGQGLKDDPTFQDIWNKIVDKA